MRRPAFPNLARDLTRDPSRLDRFDGAACGAWRRACGVSQRRLAELLGVSRGLVVRREQSAEPVGRVYVLALAAAEPLIRRERALERDRLRHRVAARRRRERERRAREAEAVAGFW